jgi:hypothetical protein
MRPAQMFVKGSERQGEDVIATSFWQAYRTVPEKGFLCTQPILHAGAFIPSNQRFSNV